MNTYSKIKLFEIHIIFRYESHVKFWTQILDKPEKSEKIHILNVSL